MEKTKNLRLNLMSANKLKNKYMDALLGGNGICTCSCYWEENGGSSTNDNGAANYKLGSGYSLEGCNYYYVYDGGTEFCPVCDENTPGNL